VYDTPTTNLLLYAPQIVSFITKALNYGSVLVHCQKGVSRSAVAVIFYLMSVQGMELNVALNLVKERRDCICPIPAFLSQLEQYEMECREKGWIRTSKRNETHVGSTSIGCFDQGKTNAEKNNVEGTSSTVATSSSTVATSSSTSSSGSSNQSRKRKASVPTLGPCRAPSKIPAVAALSRVDWGNDVVDSKKGATSTKNVSQQEQNEDITTTTTTNTTARGKTISGDARNEMKDKHVTSARIGPSLPPGFQRKS